MFFAISINAFLHAIILVCAWFKTIACSFTLTIAVIPKVFCLMFFIFILHCSWHQAHGLKMMILKVQKSFSRNRDKLGYANACSINSFNYKNIVILYALWRVWTKMCMIEAKLSSHLRGRGARKSPRKTGKIVYFSPIMSTKSFSIYTIHVFALFEMVVWVFK